MKNRNGAIHAYKRGIALTAALALLTGGLSLYQSRLLHGAEVIETVDELSGQRIGCCVAWETDYLLTGRDDITLMRYDTNADCVVALGYGQIDAIGIDAMSAQAVLNKTEGIYVLPDPIARIGYTALIPYSREDILEEFNEFAAEYSKGDEVKEVVSRYTAEGEPQKKQIELPENGKPLKVGYLTDNFPASYINTRTYEPMGVDIEMIERFAAEYGYTPEYVELTETSAGVMVASGKVDVGLVGLTDVYREEMEVADAFYMTDSYFYDDVLVLQKSPTEEFRLTSTIEG